MSPAFARRLNALGLYGLSAVLAIAFVLQLVRGELPCPLCLLQRFAFCAMAIGLIMNLRCGVRPSHYALVLLAAAGGFIFAVRQVLLHIAPGDPGYGTAILGWHYYTWAAVLFGAAVIALALVLLFDRPFAAAAAAPPPPLDGFERLAIVAMVVLTLANVGSTLLECGLQACPDNPERYRMLPAGG
jgi:disulfide bond formation protein DsbB